MSSARTTPPPRPDVKTYLLDGELILLDERHGRLFALNRTASFIWRALADGISVAQTAEQLHQAMHVPLRQIQLDIAGLLAQWRDSDLLVGARDTAFSAESKPVHRHSIPKSPPAQRRLCATAAMQGVRLMDKGLRFMVDDAVSAAAVEMVFGQDLAPAPSVAEDWPVLAILSEKGRWTLWLDDLRLAECFDPVELVPAIYGNAAKLIYQATDCFAAIHAAAVAKGTDCVLMPAASASGKSTLTAALVAGGYDYCTDDLALLTATPMRLRPVPMQIGLKSGSWDVLSALWPEIASLPTYLRADKQLVRYLNPRTYDRARRSDERLRIAAIVFPKFKRDAQTCLQKISRGEGLTRLTAAGYDLTKRLDSDSVETMLAWLETLECYELHFSDLGEAVRSFSDLLT